MAVYTRTREQNNYQINNYIVDVTEEMKEKCLDFAKQIIIQNNQYNRLLPENIKDADTQTLLRIQRTYVGKLAECVFLEFLHSNKIQYEDENMFKIFEGQENVDNFDFTTDNGQTVDIKAAFRNIHKRLVVNIEQLENIPKNFYVGVKLNAKDSDSSKKIIDFDSITTGEIYGYADINYLGRLREQNFGEGACKAVNLDNLMGIDRLLRMF